MIQSTSETGSEPHEGKRHGETNEVLTTRFKLDLDLPLHPIPKPPRKSYMAGRRRTIIAITTRIIVCLVILVLSGVIYTVLWKTKPAPERRGENRELHPVFVMRAAVTEVRRQYEGYGTA